MGLARTLMLLSLVPAVATAGCGKDPGAARSNAMIGECEQFVTSMLAAPSSYKRIGATVRPPDETLRRQTVILEYDAVNAFNAPLRSSERCDFPYGKTPPSQKVLADEESRQKRNGPADAIDGMRVRCCLPYDWPRYKSY